MYQSFKDQLKTSSISSHGCNLKINRDLFQLKASSLENSSILEMNDNLIRDGYLYIKNFFGRDEVLKARNNFLDYLEANGYINFSNNRLGYVTIKKHGPDLNAHDILGFKDYLKLVNSKKIDAFFKKLLSIEVTSFDHKWPRVVYKGATGIHCDSVYMGKGISNLYTMWLALDDINMQKGPLMVLPGSHKIQAINNTYGKGDSHEGDYGILTKDPLRLSELTHLKWASTNYEAGDVLFFGMQLLHGSLDNTLSEFRFSSDTRYQCNREPVDDRHMGDYKIKLKPQNSADWLDVHEETLLSELVEN